VRAKNAIGDGEWSDGASATPEAAVVPPGVPTGLALVAGNEQIEVSWDAVDGATGYDIVYNTSDANDPEVTDANSGDVLDIVGTDTVLTNLLNGTEYHVFVRAKNSAGESDWSASESVIPIAASTWTSVDIGAAAGTTTVNTSSSVTITGSGSTNSGGQVFRYVYTQITGDFTFTARLDAADFNSTSDANRIGLLLAPDLVDTTGNLFRYGAVFFRGNGSYVRGQRVAEANSGTSAITPGAQTGDTYLKLQKISGTVVASVSRDGGVTYVASNATNTFTPALLDTVYVGFHVNGATTDGGTGSATFSDVLIVGADGTTVLVGPNQF
jgi:hypothetical protein